MVRDPCCGGASGYLAGGVLLALQWYYVDLAFIQYRVHREVVVLVLRFVDVPPIRSIEDI